MMVSQDPKLIIIIIICSRLSSPLVTDVCILQSGDKVSDHIPLFFHLQSICSTIPTFLSSLSYKQEYRSVREHVTVHIVEFKHCATSIQI